MRNAFPVARVSGDWFHVLGVTPRSGGRSGATTTSLDMSTWWY